MRAAHEAAPPAARGRCAPAPCRGRLHCGEYLDDVKKVGFIVAPVGDGYELDAMGSPPRPTSRCKTYDDFIQEQPEAK